MQNIALQGLGFRVGFGVFQPSRPSAPALRRERWSSPPPVLQASKLLMVLALPEGGFKIRQNSKQGQEKEQTASECRALKRERERERERETSIPRACVPCVSGRSGAPSAGSPLGPLPARSASRKAREAESAEPAQAEAAEIAETAEMAVMASPQETRKNLARSGTAWHHGWGLCTASANLPA